MVGDSPIIREWLAWLLAGGGVGVVTFWLMERVPAQWGMTPRGMRYLSLGLAPALAALAWVVSILMNYSSYPTSWPEAVEGCVGAIAVALVTSQGLHGRLRLPGAGQEVDRGE